ncbi:hypothetical protein IFR05_001851 [Cadophora sp. M221]|nr:hypothetical protein IFR05_001851 [Cadophora sp. M221]
MSTNGISTGLNDTSLNMSSTSDMQPSQLPGSVSTPTMLDPPVSFSPAPSEILGQDLPVYTPVAAAMNSADVIIDPEGNLIIRLYKKSFAHSFISATGASVQGEIVKTMKVSREIVMSNSVPFMAMLNPLGTWVESGTTTVDLEDEHVVAVEL